LENVAHSTYQREIESNDAIQRAIFLHMPSSIFAVVAEREGQIIAFPFLDERDPIRT
jgi:hypothetical protein